MLLLVAACAPRGPRQLSATQLRSRASRSISAGFDEVYDATWLALESQGWTVTAHDRRAGTLSTNVIAGEHGTGRSWEASVSQEGSAQTVTLLPHMHEHERDVTPDVYWTLEGPGGELQRWDEAFARIVALVEAWRNHPELILEKTRGELDAAGLHLLLPPTWEHFEFSVDRRSLAVQRFKRSRGLNPSVLYRIERRRPEPDLEAMVHETLERAFGGLESLAEPSEWTSRGDAWGLCGEGEVLVGPGLVAQPVRWRRWEARSPAWVVRVAVACAPEGERACDFETHQILESAADANGRLVNPGSAVPGFQSR